MLLLVDSESAFIGPSRWHHVRDQDTWARPPGAEEDSLQFMAQTMEAWLCADGDGLLTYFGPGFDAARLPRRPNLEEEPKGDVAKKLDAASGGSRRGAYHKGRHLDVLAFVSPERVLARCPQASAFLTALKNRVF